MRSGKRQHARQSGFVYIALLIGVAVLGVGMGATSEVWTLTRQREKEQELLFIGNQFRQAITRFYLQSPPAARRFPLTFEELLEDVRQPDKPQHFLRQLYPDPVTNSTAWGEIRLPNGQLVGVYSPSTDTPLKVFGFALRDKALLDKEHYSDWVFRSALPAANPVLTPGQANAAPPDAGTAGTDGTAGNAGSPGNSNLVPAFGQQQAPGRPKRNSPAPSGFMPPFSGVR